MSVKVAYFVLTHMFVENPSHKKDWTQKIARHLRRSMNKKTTGPEQTATVKDVADVPKSQELDQILDEMQREVMDTTFSLPQEEGEQLAVFDIWDFGGQHVYYTTHQTFLSERAIYLLVMDITMPLDAEIDTDDVHRMWKDTGAPGTVREFLDFWLKSVHTRLVQHSIKEGQTLCPPVIIVCTKTDLLEGDPKRKEDAIDNYIESIHDHLEDKPYYQHVHDIIPISNCDVDDAGLARLRQVIVKVATLQPYWGEKRPNRWIMLADRLVKEKEARHGDPVMQLTELFKVADELGVNRDEVPVFLKCYHNLGDLVYFNTEGVDDTIVLCPQWLANMFSKVITQDHFRKRRRLPSAQRKMLDMGILSKEAATTLSDVTRPQTLIKMMEMFDMLIPCQINNDGEDEEVYLVPCLLQRVNDYQVKGGGNGGVPSVHFKFISTSEVKPEGLETKGFLPPGFFHRLISMCCRVKKWLHYKDLIFYDYMVFGVPEFCFTLHMVCNGITLSAFEFGGGNALKHAAALTKIRIAISNIAAAILNQVFPNLLCVTYLQCTCVESRSSFNAPMNFRARRAAQEPGFIPVPDEAKLPGRQPCRHHRVLVDLQPWNIWFCLDVPAVDVDELSLAGQQLQASLQPHMSTLINCMSYKIHDILVGKQLLTINQLEDIKAENTINEQNKKMYHILMMTAEDLVTVKDAVCEGLCKSSQYCPLAPPGLSNGEPVLQTEQDKLIALRSQLIEDLEVMPVLDLLFQDEIVDTQMRDWITAVKPRRERVDRLLSLISRTHKKAHC